MKRSVLVQILAAIAGPALLVGAVFFATNNSLVRHVRASEYSLPFDDQNSPSLDASGNATVTDHRGITYEYHNCQSLNNGHVTLKSSGYFGISSASPYGLKGIESIVPHFTAAGSGELWLLKSINGTDWEECKSLTDNEENYDANNWQYVRFHNYATDGTSIDINSITINYSCQTIGASEDTDLAQLSKVTVHDATNSSLETENVSSRGGSTQALRLTCTNGRSTNEHNTIFPLGYSTTLGEIRKFKVEFDYYYKEKRDPKKDPGYPAVRLANQGTGIGTKQTIGSNVGQTYTYQPFGDGWWHMECFVSALCQPAEYADSVAVDGILISDNAIYEHDTQEGVKTGFVIIDNVRLINHNHEAKLSNSTTTITMGTSDTYFLRENVSGPLMDVTYTSSDTETATIIRKKNAKNALLAYVHPLKTGTITVTIKYYIGINRDEVTVTTATLTIS
jgi:hypothetical protein